MQNQILKFLSLKIFFKLLNAAPRQQIDLTNKGHDQKRITNKDKEKDKLKF